MMEIKFRAKAIHDNQWYYGGYYEHIKRQVCPLGDSLKDEDIQPLIMISDFADWNMPRSLQIVDVDKKTVGQFTNVYDKNNKEIYEGDILKIYDYPFYRNDEDIFNYYGVVFWNKDELQFQIYTYKKPNSKVQGISEGNCENFVDYEPNICEVIGNVYENIELLGE